MKESSRRVDGRYALVRLSGQGGFADVWLAEDLRDGRQVALKLFRGNPPTGELEAVRKLNHPNIVRLLDSGESDGQQYLVFEHVDGRTLRQRLQADGPLPVAEVSELAASIGSALDYSHQLGVLHNDVKPENIMLTAHGARLLDFGSARRIRDTLSVADASSLAGTIAYIAPEVLGGEEPSTRSDIYAFGLMLHEALTGKLPWGNPAAIRGAASPETIELRMPGVPATFVEAIRQAISPAAAARPATATEVALALRGETGTVALSPGKAQGAAVPGTGAAPPRRRRPVLAAASAIAGGIALAVGGAGMLAAWGGGKGGPATEPVVVVQGAATLTRSEAAPTPTPTATPSPAEEEGDGSNAPETKKPKGKAKGRGR